MHQFPIFTLTWNSTCFWAAPLPITRSLFTVHSAMAYVIPVCRQLQFRPGHARKLSVWHIPLLNYSEYTPDDGQRNCRKYVVSCRSKSGKLVHLVGFIIKKCRHLDASADFTITCQLLRQAMISVDIPIGVSPLITSQPICFLLLEVKVTFQSVS